MSSINLQAELLRSNLTQQSCFSPFAYIYKLTKMQEANWHYAKLITNLKKQSTNFRRNTENKIEINRNKLDTVQ